MFVIFKTDDEYCEWKLLSIWGDFKIGVVTGTCVCLVYLSFPLGCVVVDTRGINLSEICGHVDNDSHVFTTAVEILDRGKIVDCTGEIFR